MDPEAILFSLADIDRAIELFCLIRKISADNGSLKTEQLFGLDGSFTSTLLADCRDDPPLTISALQAMKSLSTTLSAVSSMTESAIPEMSLVLMPIITKTGMACLPDEIIASIFESAFDLAERDRDEVTRTIVRVCRRYRRIALKSPRLWTFNKFKAGLDVDTELYLTLSRNKTLCVEIDCDEYKSAGELERIMRSIEPGADRLEELTIRAMEEKDHTLTFLAHLRENYNEVDFRSLQALRFEFWQPDWCYYDNVEEDLAGEAAEKYFFRGWRAPNLRELGLSNQIEVNDFIDTSRITCLHLSFGVPRTYSRGVDHAGRDSGRILEYLRHFEVLQELSIKLEHIDITKTSRKTLRFPTVRKLSFDVSWCMSDDLDNLANALVFPNVEHLNLRLLTYTEEDIEEWLEPFYHRTRFGGEKVTHLTLYVEISEGRQSSVRKLLDNYHNVQYLQLAGSDLELPEIYAQDHGRSFELLRIEDSRRIDKSFIDSIARARECYERSRKNVGIGRIEFVNCPYVDDRAFREQTNRG